MSMKCYICAGTYTPPEGEKRIFCKRCGLQYEMIDDKPPVKKKAITVDTNSSKDKLKASADEEDTAEFNIDPDLLKDIKKLSASIPKSSVKPPSVLTKQPAKAIPQPVPSPPGPASAPNSNPAPTKAP